MLYAMLNTIDSPDNTAALVRASRYISHNGMAFGQMQCVCLSFSGLFFTE